MGKPIPKYTEEFKRSLVTLYRNGKSLSQLCAEFGISHSALAKWVWTMYEDQSEYKDLLKQKFKVQAPNLAWVSDITYVRVANGCNYVYTVMNLYSRKIIAWKVARNPIVFLCFKR